MYTANEILVAAIEQNCTDIFIVAGHAVNFRVHGEVIPYRPESGPLTPKMTRQIIQEIYGMAGGGSEEAPVARSMDVLDRTGDDDFSFSLPKRCRFRMNAYKQRGTYAAVIRVITFKLPDKETYHIPDAVIELGNLHKGLVLVTGPAGSGKSSTLACIIDNINQTRACNIVTLEDPIEYLHHANRSVISQREIHSDTENYLTGLRSTLRQSPDVILLGEMRDYETIAVAMTAAETGHLLFSTLHTVGAANTINRIIDVFPPDQQRQISLQLSMVLTAVISQQLVPTVEGGVMPAFEIMMVNPAIRNMIRSDKVFQIDSVIASDKDTMMTMDACLLNYYQRGIITKETALLYATNAETLEKRL